LKTLVVIVGPTASGKTDVAIHLAKRYDAEIISADSRQFYKEIPIGTAAPDAEQLAQVKHHFVGHLSIFDTYNVSKFEQDVMSLLEEQFNRKEIMFLVGGSGLYVDAVCKGIDDLPDPDEALREELNKKFEKYGLEYLQQELKRLDEAYYRQVDLKNPKRLMRALEVCLQTGKKYSELRKNKHADRPFNILKIGLEVERQELFKRIAFRTDLMIRSGWLEEAEKVYPYRELNSLNTVGYKELFKYLDGEWTLEKAIEKIKTNTRRYAKRQMTWFKKDKQITWFHPEDMTDMIRFLESNIKNER